MYIIITYDLPFHFNDIAIAQHREKYLKNRISKIF